jgi:putative hydrolase of the HAD superfamily
MRVRAVFFDLDATLLAFDVATWEGVVRRVCGTVPGVNGLFHAYTSIYRAGADGIASAADARAIWGEFWERALAECGHPGDAAGRLRDLYVQERRRSYRLFDEVGDVLTALRAHVETLAIVTNGPGDAQRDKITTTGLDADVDLIVVSGEAGVAKPDRAIFDHALDRLGLAPQEVWHVGDDLATDVAGARDAGLGAAVWLNRAGAVRESHHPRPHHELGSLRELPALLARGRQGPRSHSSR